jgi:hypothetical protein
VEERNGKCVYRKRGLTCLFGENLLWDKIYGESVPAQLKKQANKNVRITFAVYEYLGWEKGPRGRPTPWEGARVGCWMMLMLLCSLSPS